MVLNCHKAVQCELWIHNECSLISQSEYEALETLTAHGFARNVKCLTSRDSYFDTQCNLESPNRFEPLVTKVNKYRNPSCSNKPTSINGLKFANININSIRKKKKKQRLELVTFLDFYKPDVVAVQETKIDETISSVELFPASCPYNVHRKDRNLHGGGVMLLINKELSHMPLKELENDSESIWVKIFANAASHYIASWYREPSGSCGSLSSLSRKILGGRLTYIKKVITTR